MFQLSYILVLLEDTKSSKHFYPNKKLSTCYMELEVTLRSTPLYSHGYILTLYVQNSVNSILAMAKLVNQK